MAAKFLPRQAFPYHGSIPRSYYLGHHRAGLNKMRNILSSIDYVVECRDYRLPISSINPAFEEVLGSTRRIVVYTKRDLGTGESHEKRQVTRSFVIYLSEPFVTFIRSVGLSNASIPIATSSSSAPHPARMCLPSSNISKTTPMDPTTSLDVV